MISTCLNPACNALFRYLSDGRIFTVERFVASPDGINRERIMEHYWLCGACQTTMKVVVENGLPTAVPIHNDGMQTSRAKAARRPVA